MCYIKLIALIVTLFAQQANQFGHSIDWRLFIEVWHSPTDQSGGNKRENPRHAQITCIMFAVSRSVRLFCCVSQPCTCNSCVLLFCQKRLKKATAFLLKHLCFNSSCKRSSLQFIFLWTLFLFFSFLQPLSICLIFSNVLDCHGDTVATNNNSYI